MKIIGKGTFIAMSTVDRDIIDKIVRALHKLEEKENGTSYLNEMMWLNKLKEI